LKIWDAASGKTRRTLTGHTNRVRDCAISPDGSWLVSASDDNTLKIWDAASGDCLHAWTDHTNRVRACAISPDGSWLVFASDDNTLRIWDVSIKICIAMLRVNGVLSSCLFCGDKYHIMAGGEGGV